MGIIQRFCLIAGLPGSGKTYLANELASSGWVVYDDPTTLDCLSDKSKKIVIADINFCRTSVRILAEQKILEANPEAKIEWIFFENSPGRCGMNVIFRAQKLSQNANPYLIDINVLSKLYEIPAGANSREVFKYY